MFSEDRIALSQTRIWNMIILRKIKYCRQTVNITTVSVILNRAVNTRPKSADRKSTMSYSI